MTEQVIYELGLRDKNFTSTIGAADGAVNKLERSILGIGGAFGIVAGAAGVGLFLKNMVTAGSMVENAKTGLTTLLGDVNGAASVIKNTMEDATKTPFAFEGLLSANKALISAGIGANNAREDVLNLANAIAATGGGDNELQRMVVNLQQISNTGKATALDIKQFAFAGVNIYKVLEAAGIKAGEGSEITYAQITSALKKAHEAGGMYYNGLENMAGNTSVQISNLGDAFFQLSVQIFNDLKPAIESIISAAASFIGTLKGVWEWAVKNKDMIKNLTISLGAAFIAFKAYTVVPAIFIAIQEAAIAAAAGTGGFAAAMTAALSPVALLAAGVGALTLVYRDWLDMEAEHQANMANLNTGVNKQQTDALEITTKNLEKQGLSRKKAIEKAKELELSSIKETEDELFRKYNRSKDSKEREGLEDQMNILRKQRAATIEYTGLIPAGKKPTTVAAGGKVASDPKTKATGHKSITINVSIAKLGETHLNITNIKEGAKQLHDHVVKALTGAVNDFQVVANNS